MNPNMVGTFLTSWNKQQVEIYLVMRLRTFIKFGECSIEINNKPNIL